MIQRLVTIVVLCLLGGGIAVAQQTPLPLTQREQSLAGAVDIQGGQEVVPYQSTAFPHDWTEGTGTLGAGGEIDVPAVAAGKHRRWIAIQNQSAATVTVEYEARLANGTTQVFPKILLTGVSANVQGSSDERGFSAFVPQGIVKVIGAANVQVAVLEVVE